VPAAPCAGEAAPRGREQRIPVNVKVNGCIHRPPPDSSQGRRRRRCEQGAPVHPPLARPRVRYLGIDPRAAGCGRDRTPAASTVDRGAAAPHGKARGERHRWGPHVTQVRVTRGTSHRTLLTRQTCASVGVSLAAQRGAGTALLTKSPRRITKMLLLFACPFTKRRSRAAIGGRPPRGRCVTHVVPLSREDICRSHNATLRRPAAISLQTHVPGRGSTSRTRQAWHRSRWLPGSLIATGRTAPRWSQVRVSCQASEAAASRSLGTSVSSSSGDTPVADVDVGGDRRA
jgi:hypothetical protein